MTGLRDAKKARTRRHLSEVATELFVARGFDAVTVAEVAAAAEVSKMTVFNHFPRKEDLFLDRVPEAAELVLDAVGGRPAGTPPVEALRELAVRLAERRHPLSGVGEGTGEFVRTVQGSPALLARVREIVGELEGTVVAALAGAGVARPEVIAAMVVAGYRAVMVAGLLRVAAGESGDDVVDDHVAALHAVFDAAAHVAR